MHARVAELDEHKGYLRYDVAGEWPKECHKVFFSHKPVDQLIFVTFFTEGAKTFPTTFLVPNKSSTRECAETTMVHACDIMTN